jgi:carboxymethylenebutenolidase
MAERSDADVNISYYGVGLDNLLGDLGNVKKSLLAHSLDEVFWKALRDHPVPL